MKICKCRTCGRTEQWEVAQYNNWYIEPNFDETIYGFYGECFDCIKEDAQNQFEAEKEVMEMEVF